MPTTMSEGSREGPFLLLVFVMSELGFGICEAAGALLGVQTNCLALLVSCRVFVLSSPFFHEIERAQQRRRFLQRPRMSQKLLGSWHCASVQSSDPGISSPSRYSKPLGRKTAHFFTLFSYLSATQVTSVARRMIASMQQRRRRMTHSRLSRLVSPAACNKAALSLSSFALFACHSKQQLN